jgi:sugar phosphate isomerase/epimerase
MRYKLCAFADEADKSIDGQIRALLDNGISLLEIRGVDGENISNITVQKAKEVRKKLSDAGISVWSVGSPIGKIKITDGLAPHLDKFKHTLEIADILGASRMRIFSFYIPKDAKCDYSDEVMERIDAFRREASGSGILLCHENEKGIYGDTAEKCLRIHRTFADIKAVFDPANFIQCGEDVKAAWEMLSPYVEYMHIKDAKREDGEVVPSGYGDGNLEYILGELFNNGYDGFLSLEPHLGSFEGLQNLQSDMGNISDEKSDSAKFTLAYNALCKILDKVGA